MILLILFRCVDVNDHEPELIFSSYPIAMSICNEVERNFEDYAFLKKYGINSSDVDFDIGDGDLDSKFNLNLKYGRKYRSIGALT